MSEHILDILATSIKERRTAKPAESYTRRLLDEAPLKPAKKLGEEAVEVALAAMGQGKDELISETADLFYHLLVVLESRDVTFDEVYGELQRRMAAASKKQEKAASA